VRRHRKHNCRAKVGVVTPLAEVVIGSATWTRSGVEFLNILNAEGALATFACSHALDRHSSISFVLWNFIIVITLYQSAVYGICTEMKESAAKIDVKRNLNIDSPKALLDTM
jgi:hypothetical protein